MKTSGSCPTPETLEAASEPLPLRMVEGCIGIMLTLAIISLALILLIILSGLYLALALLEWLTVVLNLAQQGGGHFCVGQRAVGTAGGGQVVKVGQHAEFVAGRLRVQPP